MRIRTVIASFGIAALTVVGAAGTAAASKDSGDSYFDYTKIGVEFEHEVESTAKAAQLAGAMGKNASSVANQQNVSVAGDNDAEGFLSGAGFTYVNQENPTVVFSPLW